LLRRQNLRINRRAAVAERAMSVTDASIGRETAHTDSRGSGVMVAITAFWHDLLRTMFDPYRPERHYMRGPGPACAKKHAPHS
jgi:hypothetical protein